MIVQGDKTYYEAGINVLEGESLTDYIKRNTLINKPSGREMSVNDVLQRARENLQTHEDLQAYEILYMARKWDRDIDYSYDSGTPDLRLGKIMLNYVTSQFKGVFYLHAPFAQKFTRRLIDAESNFQYLDDNDLTSLRTIYDLNNKYGNAP